MFFSIAEFNRWSQEMPENEARKWKSKYYKGLGTSTAAEARECVATCSRPRRCEHRRNRVGAYAGVVSRVCVTGTFRRSTPTFRGFLRLSQQVCYFPPFGNFGPEKVPVGDSPDSAAFDQ